MNMSRASISELHRRAVRMRRHIVAMANRGRTSHVGSALSCVDLLTALYFKWMNMKPQQDPQNSDRFILSKGHGVMAWYAALEQAGFLPEDQLESYAQNGSHLGEHPCHVGPPGISFSTGSLGHGLAVGAGQALAFKMDARRNRVFVLLSDGECNEGSVWEAAMCAVQQKLGNLVAIIDDNHMQAMGPSREISALDPLKDKWTAFGWEAIECDGHDLSGLVALDKDLKRPGTKPKVLIARTRLGKGVSFMEDKVLWHYQIPSDDDVRRALSELEAA